MQTQIVLVTPEMAKQFLSNNINNRNIRKSWVGDLVKLIKNGEWKTTHQGIAFSSAGRLLDGQHRLMAIVDANIACLMAVTTNMEAGIFDVIDRGERRTHADIHGLSRRDAEILTVAMKLLDSRPTSQQVGRLVGGRIHKQAEKLSSRHVYSVKVFSSAGMRLALCIQSLINPSHEDFLFEQYRSLCTHTFDSMDKVSKAFLKTTLGGNYVTDQRTSVMHGMKLYSPIRRELMLFRVGADESSELMNSAIDFVRADIAK